MSSQSSQIFYITNEEPEAESSIRPQRESAK